jgi:hypothetical protein
MRYFYHIALRVTGALHIGVGDDLAGVDLEAPLVRLASLLFSLANHYAQHV